MMLLLLSCALNAVDYVILTVFLIKISVQHTRKKGVHIMVFLGCVILISVINQCGMPLINLAVSTMLIALYSFTFNLSQKKRIMAIACYVGMCFITEPIGVVFVGGFQKIIGINTQVSYYGSVLVCLFIRFVMMQMIVKYLDLSKMTSNWNGIVLLVFASLLSLCICVLIINLIFDLQEGKAIVVGTLLIILVLVNNIFILSVFQRLSQTKEDNYKKSILLEELEAKEEYYREVAEGNKLVLRIKHDLKNKMLAVRAMQEEGSNTDQMWEEMMQELDRNKVNIFTNNRIIQTVLGHKVLVAEKYGILCNVVVHVPQRINMDYRDGGVLLGNLLDNAIEATQKLESSKRWIEIKIIYREGLLFISLKNSKRDGKVDFALSSKENKKNHGYGLSSVRGVVNKYNGEIDFADNTNEVEVNVILYNISTI